MDEHEYTLRTVKLLMERDKGYLTEILRKLNVKADASSSAEDIVGLMSSQEEAKPVVHESSIFKCACGSGSVTAKEIQLRSADEGSTTVYLCRACGNRW